MKLFPLVQRLNIEWSTSLQDLPQVCVAVSGQILILILSLVNVQWWRSSYLLFADSGTVSLVLLSSYAFHDRDCVWRWFPHPTWCVWVQALRHTFCRQLSLVPTWKAGRIVSKRIKTVEEMLLLMAPAFCRRVLSISERSSRSWLN